MNCQICKSGKNIFILKTTKQHLCLECIKQEKPGTYLYKTIKKSLGNDFLSNPNINEIPECLYCAPRTRGGSLIKKVDSYKYYNNIRKYCYSCAPIPRNRTLLLPHSILIHNSLSNKPLYYK